MGSANGGEDDYSSLKDFRLEINGEEGGFSLCFWLYLTNSTPYPCTLIRQMCSETSSSFPFLVLDEKKKMMLLPLFFLHKEAISSGSSTPWTEIPHASAEIVFPFDKWGHIGCEVASDLVRLYIDGEMVGEKRLNSSSRINSSSPGSRILYLDGFDGDDDKFLGFVHNVEVLAKISSIKDHFTEDPPLQLSVDAPSTSDIDEDNDGVWSIVGGKASCRRNFSLDVILLDAFGEPIRKEIEVVASLLYADNGVPVEKPNDAEAPLLSSYDGIEYDSSDRPSKLINGRASFRLKISQLSSKSENRLFRVKFDIPKFGRYPFLEAFSSPIRCISRNRNTRSSSLTIKRSSSVNHLLGESPSPVLDKGSSELLYHIVHEAKLSPSSKRVKLGLENSVATCKADLLMDQADEECNSHAWTPNEDDTATLERRPENHVTDNSLSDSESIEVRNFRSTSGNGTPISDLAIFKYCLGSINERALLLKEISTPASGKELANFAQQVSLYLGCSHHGNQVIIAKRLVEEGTKAWNLISRNNTHVIWENVVSEIKQCFMKIACCNSRFLTQQDLELLRRIAGCQELVARENFEKLWCWLYPVAFTLSRRRINAMWKSISPKWIEGFITKEEAEYSLQGLSGLQEPGTFVLRFPTSRSWPHPDAGNLVVTYVGRDYNIHHRMLSLDFIFSSLEKETTSTPLQAMLLAEPELSRLGRIIRSH